MGNKQTQTSSSASYLSSGSGGKTSSFLFPPPIETVLPTTVHTAPIHALCTLDCTHLLSGGADKRLLVYDWTSHVVKATFHVPYRDITQITYNGSGENGGEIFCGTRDGEITAWSWPTVASDQSGIISVESGSHLRGHRLSVTALASSFGYSGVLVSGSRDNSTRTWDVSTGKVVSSTCIPHNLPTGMVWIPREPCVLQSSQDKKLRVWDTRSLSVVQEFPEKQYIQLCCDVSESGSEFLSGSSGQNARGSELTLWDRRQRRMLHQYSGHHEGVNGCRFLSVTNGTRAIKGIASCGNDSCVKVWDRESKECLVTEFVSGSGPLSAIVSPSQALVCCSSFNKGVYVWRVNHVLKEHSSKFSFSLRSKY